MSTTSGTKQSSMHLILCHTFLTFQSVWQGDNCILFCLVNCCFESITYGGLTSGGCDCSSEFWCIWVHFADRKLLVEPVCHPTLAWRLQHIVESLRDLGIFARVLPWNVGFVPDPYWHNLNGCWWIQWWCNTSVECNQRGKPMMVLIFRHFWTHKINNQPPCTVHKMNQKNHALQHCNSVALVWR